MKPKAYDHESWSILLGVGAAHAVSAPDEERPQDIATLWVPDPETRHGWRERYVAAEPKPGAARRPLGFGKP